MTGGTGQDAPDTATAPMVLDDSNFSIPDEWGLKEAYNDEESVVHHGDTLYIAGTHSLRDAIDDVLIPLHLVRNSQRYQQALAAPRRRCRGQARSAVPRLSRSAHVRRAAAAQRSNPELACVS